MKIFCLLNVLIICRYSEGNVNFAITNRDGGPIWVGIQGNANQPPLNNGGFVLNQGQTTTVSAPDDWSGRFWSRTYCDPGSKHCLTGDCGNKVECNGAGGVPPATLAEIKLKGDIGKDVYDISLVDGYNSKASIEPVNGKGDGSRYSCTKSACKANINSKCPGELQLKNNQGVVIGCKSGCAAFNTPEYCCTGEFNDPNKCKSTNYGKLFKDQCPDAYSFAYNDNESTFTCQAQAYNIVFG